MFCPKYTLANCHDIWVGAGQGPKVHSQDVPGPSGASPKVGQYAQYWSSSVKCLSLVETFLETLLYSLSIYIPKDL